MSNKPSNELPSGNSTAPPSKTKGSASPIQMEYKSTEHPALILAPLKDMIRAHIRRAITGTSSKIEAAAALGISRRQLYRYIEDLDLRSLLNPTQVISQQRVGAARIKTPKK